MKKRNIIATICALLIELYLFLAGDILFLLGIPFSMLLIYLALCDIDDYIKKEK